MSSNRLMICALHDLSIWNECCVGRGDHTIVPTSLQPVVLPKVHDGHLGVVRMKQRRILYVCMVVGYRSSGRALCPGVRDLSSSWEMFWSQNRYHCSPSGGRRNRAVNVRLTSLERDQPFLIVVHDLCSKWPEITSMSILQESLRRLW